jgi:hypothetical protein
MHYRSYSKITSPRACPFAQQFDLGVLDGTGALHDFGFGKVGRRRVCDDFSVAVKFDNPYKQIIARAMLQNVFFCRSVYFCRCGSLRWLEADAFASAVNSMHRLHGWAAGASKINVSG